ncbi:MAG TPA: non-homologous end-joining DNA ligase [Halanaerobiales bacterium]|nr:non-homologous end-joining DNA ligase [Halanaerobiales bacterium]
MSRLSIGGFVIKLSNLDKVFWPEKGYTKGELINYYTDIYPLIHDFLKDRPLSLKIYPDGINGSSFFQKNTPDYAPDWLTTHPIYSKHRMEYINWVTVNKIPDLVWVINRAAIELHCWFSTIKNPDKPDFAVFDLDPGSKSDFERVMETALLIKDILDELELNSFVKTSGKSGLHIYVPVKPVYNYKDIKKLLKNIAEMVIKIKPELATIEWRKKARQGKIYIDYRQNERGKTLPAPYSIRPTNMASISTPLRWQELQPGLKPEDFTLGNIKNRLDELGDIWSGILKINQELPRFIIK